MTVTEPTRLRPKVPPRPKPTEAQTAEASVPDHTADDETARGAALNVLSDRWRSSVPRRFWSARADDFAGQPCHEQLTGWATTVGMVPNLLIFGDVGVGKTHAAVAACRPSFGDGATLEVTPVGEMLDRLDWRRPDSAVWLEHCCAVDLLVLDDLGTERSNEWTGERLYLIVNRRWLEGRPIVATTNLAPTGEGSIEEAIGPRSFSRLAGGALALNLGGGDRRRGR